MHLAIANITNGGLSGGSRKYLNKLAPLLAADPRIDRLDVFVPPRTPEQLAPLPETPWQTWPAVDVNRGFRGLRRRLEKLAPDVLYIPTARWLRCDATPTVVSLRNMEPPTVPFGRNPWSECVRNFFRATAARRACERATRVIAISDFVRDFLIEQWRIDPARVSLVYHGVDPQPAGESIRPTNLNSLQQPFLFTAGAIRPAHGLEDAVWGLAACDEPMHLVVAGGVDPRMTAYQQWLFQLAVELGVTDRIHWTGRLSEAELAWCFDNCAAFVMTSHAEACPNVVLEALQRGCLSVSTDQPPMPEFFGSAAVYYRGRDAAHLEEQLRRVLHWPAADQDRLRQAARAQVREWTWERTADLTASALLEACRTRGAHEPRRAAA